MQMLAIIKKVKEGKLVVADQKHFCAKSFTDNIAAKVENDLQPTRSGSCCEN
jgi:hypothetical protein